MAGQVRGQLRVWSLFTGPTVEGVLEGRQPGSHPDDELGGLPKLLAWTASVHGDIAPKDLDSLMRGNEPTVVYLHGGVSGQRAGLAAEPLGPLRLLRAEGGPAMTARALSGHRLELIYLDAAASMEFAEAVFAARMAPHVIAWPAAPAPLALPAMHFARALFAALTDPAVSVPEAFAMASSLTTAFASPLAGSGVSRPALPRLLSAAAPALPGPGSVAPLLGFQGSSADRPVHTCVPGYGEVRLLAPHAELRLRLSGIHTQVTAPYLGHFCEALRALLVTEARGAVVAGAAAPCPPPAGRLPAGAAAVRVTVRTTRGALVTVVLAGPPSVLAAPPLVQHALRQTLAADAAAVQLKLPPPGAPPPAAARSAPGVAAGAPVVETLAVCSVWAVGVLRALARDGGCRALAAMGVAAVSDAPVAAFSAAHAARFAALVSGDDPDRLGEGPPPGAGPAARAAPAAAPTPAAGGQPPRPPSATAAAVWPLPRSPSGGAAAAGGLAQGLARHRGGSSSPSDADEGSPAPGGGPPPAAAVAPWRSSRPPLAVCSEEAFLADVRAFLEERQGPQAPAEAFPEATLNASRLDLLSLYREVARRGGYRVGNDIDWKGRVFPRMRNFSGGYEVAGVGNALKRHYQLYLLDYERARPGDAQRDACALCGRAADEEGGGGGDEWAACEGCNCWVHFSCDARPGVGAFEDYARPGGRAYSCPRCDEARARRDAAAAPARGPPPVAPAVRAVPDPRGASPAAAAAALVAAREAQLWQVLRQADPPAQQQQPQPQPASEAVAMEGVSVGTAAAAATGEKVK